MMPTIVFFEIPANDIDCAKDFYSDLFSWRIEHIPGMDYWGIDADENTGRASGGMLKRAHPDQRITNYIGVSSVEEYSSKVNALGGKILLPKNAVPGRGYFAVCQDTEGNVFILWESDEKAR